MFQKITVKIIVENLKHAANRSCRPLGARRRRRAPVPRRRNGKPRRRRNFSVSSRRYPDRRDGAALAAPAPALAERAEPRADFGRLEVDRRRRVRSARRGRAANGKTLGAASAAGSPAPDFFSPGPKETLSPAAPSLRLPPYPKRSTTKAQSIAACRACPRWGILPRENSALGERRVGRDRCPRRCTTFPPNGRSAHGSTRPNTMRCTRNR